VYEWLEHIATTAGTNVFHVRPWAGRATALRTQSNSMNTPRSLLIHAASTLVLAVVLVWPATVDAQQIVTNWAAYNDYIPGPVIPPHVSTPANWGTAARVTTHNMRLGPGGPLTNYLTGEELAITMTVTATGTPDDFPTMANPGTNTPAGQLFYRIVDVANTGSGIGIRASTGSGTTLLFSNLDPFKRYIFRGTASRGGSYATRWTVATITNVTDFLDAHLDGSGPGVITSNDFPANLGAGQAAFNSGHNLEGAVVGWDFISPAPDGTITIMCNQYVGPTPNGGQATADSYGYAFAAMLIGEVEASQPGIATNPPPATTIEQNRPFRLSVSGTGTPLFYQWYRNGTEIPGAIFSAYSVAKAALTDAGAYTVRVYNPLGSVTSTVAQVTVNADVAGPTIAAAFSFPGFDFATQTATLNDVTVEFNEPVFGASIASPANYTLSGGGGNPVSVVQTNDRVVILTFASSLSEDTDYTITVGSAQDELGNTSANFSRAFHTWVAGPGNGLLYEFYNTGPGLDVVALTSSPVFPDNASFRTNLWGFDTRIVLPDNSVENFGARISGIFIPPFTSDWTFYLRAWDRAEVYLNPNGMNPAGKQLILAETTGNAPRDYQKLVSLPIRLQGGQGYYIEALQKADVGTDALKLAVLPNAGTNTPPIGIADTDIDTNAVLGGLIGFPLAPKDLGGTLTISQQPANTTAEENHDAVFTVQVNNPSGAPVHYQWFRNGVEIPGATGPTYAFPATSADNNQDFSVRAAKVGSQVTSTTARLTVAPDTTKPRAVSVTSNATNLMEIIVHFDERMNIDDLREAFNFFIVEEGGPPVAAVEGADGKSAILTLAVPLIGGNSYSVRVENARDLAGNAINSVTLTFTAGGMAPNLAIALSGADVIISWPAPSTGFVLEENTSLSGATAWATVTGTPTVVGGQNTLTLTRTGAARFFRLRQ
jgi:hypothetical protein